MALFSVKNNKLLQVKEKRIDLEKYLQALVEENLQALFGLEFISTEFNPTFIR